MTDPAAESSRAEEAIQRTFGSGAPNLLLLVTPASGDVDDRAATAAGLDLTDELAGEAGVTDVRSYWSLGEAPTLRSRHGRSALVVGRAPGDEDAVRRVV